MNRSHLRSLLLALFLAFGASTVTGCNGLHKIANAVGVKSKTVSLKTKDLGSTYSSLINTEWDFFSAKSGKERIAVKYKTVGVKSIDNFNASASMLYAQYMFADKLLEKTLTGVSSIFNISLDNKTFNEIIRAIQKRDVDQISQIRELKKIKTNITYAVKGTVGLVGRAQDIVNTGKDLVNNVVAEVSADPRRALLADIALEQTKQSISRASDVLKGAPGLIKKITSIADVLTSIVKLI